MKRIANTLYVTQEGAFVHKDGLSIVVHRQGSKIAQFPMLGIGEIVCFGFGISISPQLSEHCAQEGITVSYLSGTGRFLARMVGPTQGNVLLRREQYRIADDPMKTLSIARCCVAAKISNQRQSLLRFARNHQDAAGQAELIGAAESMARDLTDARAVSSVETLRGIEGDASRRYFEVFGRMVINDDESFRFSGRSRRPPLDRTNAMLSFVYTLLALDIRSALESVGLDPFVGYLHVERPGRPALALDLMEEFRSAFADRLVLSLINLKEVDGGGFVQSPTGEVEMKPETRKTLLAAYQKRKREVLRHPFLEEEMELGVGFLTQARLLARHVRGDLEFYPAWLWR